MFSSNPFFEPANDSVIVWIGSLSPDELDDYLHEPGSDVFDTPISAFSRDLGRWYDHDFIWSEAIEVPASMQTLCELNGIEPMDFVREIVKRSGNDTAKCLLILWNARQIDNSSDRLFAGGRLRCLGCWKQQSPLKDPE